MATLKLYFASPASIQFEAILLHAVQRVRLDEFINSHNAMVTTLSDLNQAIVAGEPLYRTKKAGGIVRQYVRDCIAVTYLILEKEQVAWIIKYQTCPASWPD